MVIKPEVSHSGFARRTALRAIDPAGDLSVQDAFTQLETARGFQPPVVQALLNQVERRGSPVATESQRGGALAVVSGLVTDQNGQVSPASIGQGACGLLTLCKSHPALNRGKVLESGLQGLNLVGLASGCQLAVELCGSPLPPSAVVTLLASMRGQEPAFVGFSNMAESKLLACEARSGEQEVLKACDAATGVQELLDASEAVFRSKLSRNQDAGQELMLHNLLKVHRKHPREAPPLECQSADYGLLKATAALGRLDSDHLELATCALQYIDPAFDAQIAARTGLAYLTDLARSLQLPTSSLKGLQARLSASPAPISNVELGRACHTLVLDSCSATGLPSDKVRELAERARQGPGNQPAIADLLLEARSRGHAHLARTLTALSWVGDPEPAKHAAGELRARFPGMGPDLLHSAGAALDCLAQGPRQVALAQEVRSGNRSALRALAEGTTEKPVGDVVRFLAYTGREPESPDDQARTALALLGDSPAGEGLAEELRRVVASAASPGLEPHFGEPVVQQLLVKALVASVVERELGTKAT